MIIYHITTKTEWKAALETGFYTAASLAGEGFIHCALEQQVAGVLERYFQDKTGLVKLRIDVSKLVSQLRFDYSEAVKESFPHLCGPLNLSAVTEISEVI